MVLVDTSVWIDFFKNTLSPQAQILSQLIELNQDIAICGVIRQEVLQGVRDDLTFRRIQNLLDQAHYLALQEPTSFDEAAKIYRSLRKKGVTIRSYIDCLIASLAIRFEVPLLQKDRDYLNIARFTSLRLYQ